MQVVRGLGRHLELQEAAKRQKQMQREREQVHTAPHRTTPPLDRAATQADGFLCVLSSCWFGQEVFSVRRSSLAGRAGLYTVPQPFNLSTKARNKQRDARAQVTFAPSAAHE